MSAKSRRSAKAIDRPFEAELLATAKRLAAQYQVILTLEEGQWYGRGLELPNVFGDGKTPAQCVKNTQEALAGAVAYMLEKGQRPPSPARSGARTQQVNIRLSPEEKVLLEAAARQRGFTGVSDFVRSAAVDAAK